MSGIEGVDYTNWDWLPRAAGEIESYVRRLIDESGTIPHDVTARAKTIDSFQRKQRAKDYSDPLKQVTDIVAIRVITYSVTDRDRVGNLIRSRLAVLPGEDRNPGVGRPDDRRGYDCLHLVVSGEIDALDSDWLVSGGALEKYFKRFGGLEVQIRTVASHAWAEFEHARRYKGAQYNAVSDQDKGTVDQLFGAASDTRRALDEIFVAIDRILARPTIGLEDEPRGDRVDWTSEAQSSTSTPVDVSSLARYLEARFPDDGEGSLRGIDFAVEVIHASGIDTLEGLDAVLEDVDSDQVRTLMDLGAPVTRVRRLDDELLSHFGQDHIDRTGHVGRGGSRILQLEGRFDRLRGKTRYRAYFVLGRPDNIDLKGEPLTAVGAMREVIRILARERGPERVTLSGLISLEHDLPSGTRAKEIVLSNGSSIWVASNLNRSASENVMAQLLGRARPIDLRVERDELVVADGRARTDPSDLWDEK